MGTIRKQGIQNTVVTYFGIIIGFLNLIVLQPYCLSPEEIGLTRVLFNFSMLVAVFLPMGVANITIKYFPVFRNIEKQHHGYFGFMLLFPFIGFIIISFVLYLLHDFIISKYIAESKLFTEYFDYVFPLSLALGLISVLNYYAFALFKTTFPSLLNDVIARVFSMIVICIYFLKWISLNQFVFLFVSVYALQLILLLFYIYQIDKPGWKPNKEFLKTQNLSQIFGYGFILSFVSFAALGLKLIDTVMIGVYLPLANVGIYSIAAFISTVIEAPLNSLDKISTTKIAHAIAMKNMDDVKVIYYKSCRYLLLLGGLLFVGININIHSLYMFLPPAFSGGESVVFIISLGTLVNMAIGSNGAIIFSSDKYKFGAVLLAMITLVAFFSNMMLIPRFGLTGAAMSTAFATFLYCLVRYVFIYLKFGLQPFDQRTLKVAGIILSSFVVNYFLPILSNPLADIILRSSVITIVFVSSTFFLQIVPEFHEYIPFLKNKRGE